MSSLSRLPLNERQQNDDIKVSNIVYIRDLVVDATVVLLLLLSVAVALRGRILSCFFSCSLQEANDESVGEKEVGSELKFKG